MVMKIPAAVQDVLSKLDPTDRGVVEAYIADLQSKGGDVEDEDLPDAEEERGDADDEPMSEAKAKEEEVEEEDVDYPPIYESGEDYDKAGDAKQAAADLKDAGNWEGALDKYTEAVLAAPPSALLYANRAQVLFQLGRYKAAERDCNLAIMENPDSAKALRIRGKVRKELQDYENALKDLSASQAIDFDEGTVEDLKFLTEKHLEKEKDEAEERIKHEEKLRKRAEEIKQAREEAKREAASSRGMPGGMGGMPGGMGGGMPGGMPGMPGGMGGMPGMEGLMADMMKDPELLAALQKPKVQAAMAQLMGGGGDPAKMAELMSDPEVGPILQKFMSKVSGGMGGSGFGSGSGGGAANDDEDIPDLDDLPDLE